MKSSWKRGGRGVSSRRGGCGSGLALPSRALLCEGARRKSRRAFSPRAHSVTVPGSVQSAVAQGTSRPRSPPAASVPPFLWEAPGAARKGPAAAETPEWSAAGSRQVGPGIGSAPGEHGGVARGG